MATRQFKNWFGGSKVVDARVADDAGRGEQTPGSMAAALERLNQPRTTIRNVGQVRPMSLSRGVRVPHRFLSFQDADECHNCAK